MCEEFIVINNQLAPISELQNKLMQQTVCNEEEPGDGEHINLQSDKDDRFSWDYKSTLLFLDEYQSRLLQFRNPAIKKKVLWGQIAEAMNLKGYQVDRDILDRKMRNMKSTFNKIKDNNKKKRTGRGVIHWEYYNVFCAIFSDDKTVNTGNLVSSLPLSENAESAPSTSDSNILPATIVHAAEAEETVTPSNSSTQQKNWTFFERGN